MYGRHMTAAIAWVALCAVSAAPLGASGAVRDAHVEAELIAAGQSIEPGTALAAAATLDE